MKLGVKVVHCSERDTQISDQPKQVDEFVNTWSIEGFREEGTTTAEMGWGTHEKELPPRAFQHEEGPRSQICLAQMGMNTWVRSWVPNYTERGMVVRHGEAFTISDRLTVTDDDGKAIYRPTVHYAYCPSDAAIASLNEMRGYDYKLQPRLRIMNDEITTGADILGALIMGHTVQLLVDRQRSEHRRIAPSGAAPERDHHAGRHLRGRRGVMWMIENPEMSVVRAGRSARTSSCSTSAGRTSASSSRRRRDWTPLQHYHQSIRGLQQAAARSSAIRGSSKTFSLRTATDALAEGTEKPGQRARHAAVRHRPR